ncbi:hypothetical protein AVL50_11275 [Flammeovirga sp. SJP92]|nr:hypothetical protein AVL50_11275 [Flammeovirga sp. SJP92]
MKNEAKNSRLSSQKLNFIPLASMILNSLCSNKKIIFNGSIHEILNAFPFKAGEHYQTIIVESPLARMLSVGVIRVFSVHQKSPDF